MDKQSNLEALCESVVQRAQSMGATSSDAHVSHDEGFSVTARMGEIESVEHHVEQSLSITVYVDHKSGDVSTNDLSDDAINKSIEKALSIAKFTQDDPCAGLADKDRLAKKIPDLDLDHPWDLTPSDAIELTKECEAAGLNFDQRITNSEGASLTTNRARTVFANSDGFVGSYYKTGHSMNCILIAKENNHMQRAYDYTYARDYNDLIPAVEMAKSAAKKTTDRLNPKKIETKKVPVIFNHELAVGFLSNLFRAISGSSIYRKSSFLLDHIDKKIFPEWMQITQRPHMKKGVASRPFDSEGVETVDRDFIQDGVLKSYLLSSYSARKLNLQTTGNSGGIQNMEVKNSGINFEELIAQMGTGLLVTELIGQGINIVTGDYSRGAFGYWVENGEIQYPVEGITIAGNLKDMFNNIVAIADDIDTRAAIRTGSILLDEMMVAG